MANRKKISKQIITDVTTRSRRRCCICFGLDRDDREKRGQIAHLDHNPSNNTPDNLAFLCLHHHDDYDSRRSQSKGLGVDEVKRYQTELLAFVALKLPALHAESFLPLELNLDDTFSGSPIDLSRLTRKLVFSLKKGQPMTVRVLYPELKEYDAYIDAHLKNPNSSDDSALQLLDYVLQQQKRAERIQVTIDLLFSPRVNKEWSYLLVSESDWQGVLAGVLSYFSTGGRIGKGLTKIDIWRTEEPKLSAPIFVTDEELNAILQVRGLSDVRQLAFGPGWVAADELPAAILVSKALPRILVSLAASTDEIRDEHFESALCILSWHVGLG